MELSTEGKTCVLMSSRNLFYQPTVATPDNQTQCDAYNNNNEVLSKPRSPVKPARRATTAKPKRVTRNQEFSSLSRPHLLAPTNSLQEWDSEVPDQIRQRKRSTSQHSDDNTDQLPTMLDIPIRLTTSITEVQPVKRKTTVLLSSREIAQSIYPEEPGRRSSSSGDVTERLCTIPDTEDDSKHESPSPPEETPDQSNSPALSDASMHKDNEPMDNEKVSQAKLKRGYVLSELIETEQNYVSHLNIIVNGYMEQLTNMTLPEGLEGKSRIVFGNVRAILNFHESKFLPAIRECYENPQALGQLFSKYEKQLRLYITYCENKPRSEYLVRQYATVFKQLEVKVGERLSAQDLLIKPVQRIMKYQLLLKDILKYTEKARENTIDLHKAMDVMLTVPKAANNMMEVGRLEGFEIRMPVHGTILLQDTLPVAEFDITKSGSRKYRERRIFLFEQIVIISDIYEKAMTGLSYKYRASIKLSDLKLVEKVFEEPTSFIFSDVKNSDIDIYIQAPNFRVKEEWIHQANSLLSHQQDFLSSLLNPMANLRLKGRSSRVSRSKSDRPEIKPLSSQGIVDRHVKSYH